jgi:glucokinase
MILAGDIGGTNARVALFDADLRAVRAATYRTAELSGLADLVGRFVNGERPAIASAAFGVAGTIADGVVTGVNLPWTVTADELEFPVALVNDLEANARGVDALGARDFAVLNHGVAKEGNQAVVSAGTGLGEALRVWDGDRHHVVAGEGGHADFAPRSELEISIFRELAAQYGHVSYERVCSGAGLVAIYRVLRGPMDPDAVPDPAAIAAEAAVDPRSIAARALDVFVSIYGARAGNVALSVMATGGVYLGGGIAPKILTRLQAGAFMRAFADKGRFAAALRRIPVRVILNDRAAMLGAARIAAEQSPANHPAQRYS